MATRAHPVDDFTSLNTKRPYCRIMGTIGVSAHTKALRHSLVARDGIRCWICQDETPPHDRTIDHILPVSLGGKSELSNLKIAHAHCNSFRSSKVHLSAEELVAQIERRRQRDANRAKRARLRALWKRSIVLQEQTV
jgi:5-methylcytosine-specific restriction endonuclease McrA